MSRGKKVAAWLGAAALSAGVVAVVLMGFVGSTYSVAGGAQVSMCGQRLGIAGADEYGASVSGLAEEPLKVGERVRVHPLCVIEVVDIDVHEVDPDAVGGYATVTLNWRLW